MIAQRTGFCTNEDTSTSWQVQVGQQMSFSPGAGELYSELRLVDDVVIGSKRPFVLGSALSRSRRIARRRAGKCRRAFLHILARAD
jgi:hypothetical protein